MPQGRRVQDPLPRGFFGEGRVSLMAYDDPQTLDTYDLDYGHYSHSLLGLQHSVFDSQSIDSDSEFFESDSFFRSYFLFPS